METYIKVIYPDKRYFVTDSFDASMLDGAEGELVMDGDRIVIARVSMSPEEYEKLPEFEG